MGAYWIMASLLAILTFLYVLLLGKWCRALLNNGKELTAKSVELLTVSIVVPFRNEAHNLSAIVSCIASQDYPIELLECLLVDDHSQDQGLEIARSLVSKTSNIRIISLKEDEVGKKAAITEGIRQATGTLILTTDADCKMGPNWVKSTVNAAMQNQADMLIQPVFIGGNSRRGLQALEQMLMTGIGNASALTNKPLVCSGANLAFRRDRFLEVGGYNDNKSIASGDDVFLMQSFTKKDLMIEANGLQDVWVETESAPNLQMWFSQRIRWASKISKYQEKDSKSASLILAGYNVAIAAMFVVSIWLPELLVATILGFSVKWLIDLLLLILIASTFKRKHLLWWFPVGELLYIPYILIISIASVFIPVQWKERSI